MTPALPTSTPKTMEDKKKITALNNDKKALAKRIAHADALLAQIDGQLSEDKARKLILAKLYDIAHAELERYLDAEKRGLVLGIENLWDKYAVSSRGVSRSKAGCDDEAKLKDLFMEKTGTMDACTADPWTLNHTSGAINRASSDPKSVPQPDGRSHRFIGQ